MNSAPRETLLRIPGLGPRAVDRIIAARRFHRLRLDDIARITVSIAKLHPFLIAADWRPIRLADSLLASKTEQLELFAA